MKQSLQSKRKLIYLFILPNKVGFHNFAILIESKPIGDFQNIFLSSNSVVCLPKEKRL